MKNETNQSGARERLRRYEVSQGLTWKQVADGLGISLSMVMQVNRGDRNLSAKALYKLQQLELEAAARTSAAGRIVERLLDDEGSARELVESKSRRRAGRGIPLNYVDARRAQTLPLTIDLVRPSEEGCRRLRRLYADTLDAQIVLLACLPSANRTESFLALLTAATMSRLQRASLQLAFGERWRSKLADLAVGGDRAKTKD